MKSRVPNAALYALSIVVPLLVERTLNRYVWTHELRQILNLGVNETCSHGKEEGACVYGRACERSRTKRKPIRQSA